MPALTIEAVTAEPWKFTASQWQAAHNVHQPYIAEISPMQYAHLSKRGRAQYDAKREQEWTASAACKHAWKLAVIAAHDAGSFHYRDAEVSDEAKHVVIGEQIDREQQAQQDAYASRDHENKVEPGAVRIGDTVWSIMAGKYLPVVKINRQSLVIETPFGPMKQPFGACQWLKHDDYKAAVDRGAHIGPERS